MDVYQIEIAPLRMWHSSGARDVPLESRHGSSLGKPFREDVEHHGCLHEKQSLRLQGLARQDQGAEILTAGSS